MIDVPDFANYPMTTVSEMPLHPTAHLRSCEYSLQHGVDPLQDWRHEADSDPITVPLSWLVERADYFAGARSR